MIRMVVFAAVMMAGIALAQTKPAWQQLSQGQLILRPFANAPYPHSSREKGFKNFTREGHYDDSTVAVFIPSHYKPGERVNYAVHFHGHTNHVSNVLEKYKLPQQFADAKVNAILIVPQGPKDAADSGDGKLELDQAGFEKLIDEVTDFLNAEGKIHTRQIGRIALSAHSGGYKVTAAILNHGGLADHITEVLLLDASYGSLEWFADWCKADAKHRLVSLFTDHLADENKQLMALLDKAGVKYATLEEAKLSDDQLVARRPIFMHTKGPHDQVPVDYFGRLIRSSALAQ